MFLLRLQYILNKKFDILNKKFHSTLFRYRDTFKTIEFKCLFIFLYEFLNILFFLSQPFHKKIASFFKEYTLFFHIYNGFCFFTIYNGILISLFNSILYYI